MATKLYFHDAASGAAGTLPGATSLEVTAGGSAPTWTATGATTNRSMSTTPGLAQTSVVGTNNAVTTAQSGWLRRFLSDPLAAQTISLANNTQTAAGLAESNTNSTFNWQCAIYVWRPSTGALVGTLAHADATTGAESVTTTVETWVGPGTVGPTSSLAVQAGDILVVECWRSIQAQGMATAYTNSFWYDGTTESSATSAASYINLAQTLTFQGAAASLVHAGRRDQRSGALPPFIIRRPALLATAVKPRWRRSRGGLLVPAYA